MRAKAELEKLRKMNPEIVIPGHAPYDNFSADPNALISFTLDYLNYFDDILATVKTGDELVEHIEGKYPLTAMRFGLHWQARFMFHDSCSGYIP